MIRTPSTDATAGLVARLASAGRNDPTIATRLGISASQVRRLREEYEILPGETRWLSHQSPLNPRYVRDAT